MEEVQKYKAELERNELCWWMVTMSTGDDTLGIVFVQAFGPTDAMVQVQKKGLTVGEDYEVRAVTDISTLPEGLRNRLLTRDEFDAGVEVAEGEL